MKIPTKKNDALEKSWTSRGPLHIPSRTLILTFYRAHLLFFPLLLLSLQWEVNAIVSDCSGSETKY